MTAEVLERPKVVATGRNSARRRGFLLGAVLMAPAVVVAIAISCYPVLRTLWWSTRDSSLGVSQDRFTGMRNFTRLLSDQQFWSAWKQTVGFTAASTLLETLLGLLMALVLARAFRGRAWVRAAVLVPWAIPTVVTTRMFEWLFDGQNGVVNYLLSTVGITHHYINFTGDPSTALGTIVIADVWKTAPFMALLILAGLQGIPHSQLESARVEGASPWQVFWHVRLPLVMPALLTGALLRALDAFRIFDLPYLLTGGGPADSTETLSTLAYKRLFSGLELGYGSTISTAMFCTEALIALGFAFLLSRRYKAVEG